MNVLNKNFLSSSKKTSARSSWEVLRALKVGSSCTHLTTNYASSNFHLQHPWEFFVRVAMMAKSAWTWIYQHKNPNKGKFMKCFVILLKRWFLTFKMSKLTSIIISYFVSLFIVYFFQLFGYNSLKDRFLLLILSLIFKMMTKFFE